MMKEDLKSDSLQGICDDLDKCPYASGQAKVIHRGNCLPMTISFEDVNYKVDIGVSEGIKSYIPCIKNETYERQIIKSVTGAIKPGQMTALMGPSGAGKSTLLDILSHRQMSGRKEGEVLYNGQPWSKGLKRTIGYVEQKDILIPTLTPREIIRYTAQLKLRSSVTPAEIEARVDSIIEELGLSSCQDTLIGDYNSRGISGGQAKRVNIGIELVTDPKVLFLDEPTTGLDSSIALEVMEVVRGLATRGRSVIATIHQPSEECFSLFDNLILLVAGEVAYNGKVNAAAQYFQSLGIHFQSGTNLANNIVCAVDPIPRGDNDQFKAKDPRFFAKQFSKSSMAMGRLKSVHTNNFVSQEGSDITENPSGKSIENGLLYNIGILTKRFSRMRYRDTPFMAAKFVRSIVMCIMVCLLFANQDCSTDGVYNIFSVLSFSVMNFSFSALAAMGQLFQERAFFKREVKAGTYQTLAYFLGMWIAELPYGIIQVLIYTAPVYWVVGLRSSFSAFVLYTVSSFLLLETGTALCSIFSYYANDFQMGLLAFYPWLIICYLFSGFYVQVEVIPCYWKWGYYLSFINYGFNAIAINQFNGSDKFLECTGATDAQILEDWGLGNKGALHHYSDNFATLIGFFIALKSLSFMVLKLRNSY
eukprot:Nk52_evm74s2367 gene=Nk52_evmTU74s2367